MTILGLEDGKVELYPHDEAWETIAKDMMKKIKAVMQDDVLEIDHDGGTSIRCAWAKPIIDIIVLVPDFSVIEKHLPALSKLGIEYDGKILPLQHWGYIRTADGKGKSFHIHFAVPESEFRREHLDVRDLLNSDPLAGRIYSDSKRLYAGRTENERLSYREEKHNMYEVLCQVAQARRERLEGKKTGPSFIDDLFMTILAALEEEAIVYSDGRDPLLRKELAGNLLRAAERLKACGISKQERVLIAADDIANQLAVILGAAYAGIACVLTEETDAEKLEELRSRTSARMILRDDFLEDLHSVRGHLREESHSEADEVLLFPYEDAPLSVSFGDMTAEVEKAAGEIRKEPGYACSTGCRIASRREVISILASLCSGGSLYIL